MAKVKLGKDQTIAIDGATLLGTREVEVDLELKANDITSWDHAFASTLGTTFDATITLTIYWAEDYARIAPKLTQHPPVPLAVVISNVGTIYCLPLNVKVTQPISGVLAWQVVMRMHCYNVP